MAEAGQAAGDRRESFTGGPAGGCARRVGRTGGEVSIAPDGLGRPSLAAEADSSLMVR
ncbi:hypothetical protein GCM10023196_080770 [Actinoallomurus vinaceus]|uniref:Uncharacterized protein n=1 Tax=Actinoallomurus vinaceus TaxID=1080074 RepID=A0ABP8UMN1_9ACTN